MNARSYTMTPPLLRPITALRHETSPSRPTRRSAAVVAALAVAASTLVLTATEQPGAAWERHTVTADGVALREGPTTGHRVLQRVNRGTPVDIECQVQNGTSVGGNRTWNRLTGKQWISDFYTTTSSYNSYHPGMVDCATFDGQRSGSAGRDQRAEAAIAWASSKAGRAVYDQRCAQFVARAYGYDAYGYYSAADGAERMQARGVMRSGQPPRGALVFYGRHRVNNYHGHVLISLGDGRGISTNARGAYVGVVPLTQFDYARRLGWVSPHEFVGWSGRRPANA